MQDLAKTAGVKPNFSFATISTKEKEKERIILDKNKILRCEYLLPNFALVGIVCHYSDGGNANKVLKTVKVVDKLGKFLGNDNGSGIGITAEGVLNYAREWNFIICYDGVCHVPYGVAITFPHDRWKRLVFPIIEEQRVVI